MFPRLKIPKGFWVITGVYLAIFILLLPLYGKAFGDDFAYIKTVENLVRTGVLKIHEWTAVSLVAQVYWGAFFSYLLGFSFKTLILSTVLICYLGVIAFYFLLREFDLSDFGATSFTLAFLGYPWVLLYTYTFLTDVPYVSIFILSLLFLFGD